MAPTWKGRACAQAWWHESGLFGEPESSVVRLEGGLLWTCTSGCMWPARPPGHPGEFELCSQSYGNPIRILNRRVRKWAGFPAQVRKGDPFLTALLAGGSRLAVGC